jgi:hypothetical protein
MDMEVQISKEHAMDLVKLEPYTVLLCKI